MDKNHYTRLVSPNNNQSIYLCPTVNDMGFIPKEICHEGDVSLTQEDELKFLFQNGRWELVK